MSKPIETTPVIRSVPRSIWEQAYVDQDDPQYKRFSMAAEYASTNGSSSSAGAHRRSDSQASSVYSRDSDGITFRAPIGTTLRSLYTKGHTYTLTPQVEEILSSLSTIGTELNKYRSALQNGVNDWGNVCPDADTKDPGKHLDEVWESCKKLLLTVHSILDPLQVSVQQLKQSLSSLPSLSDGEFLCSTYEDRLLKAVKWDQASRSTMLYHILPQYLPIYNSLRKIFSAELPSMKDLERLIQDPRLFSGITEVLANIQTAAVMVECQANEAFALTKSLTGGLHNCLMTLQYQSSEMLHMNALHDRFIELIAGIDKTVEAASNCPPELKKKSIGVTADDQIVIFHTLVDIVRMLRLLKLGDNDHIIAQPASYFDNTVEKTHQEAANKASTEEGCQPRFYWDMVELRDATARLWKLRPLDAHVPAKWILPYLLDIASYTRGSTLMHPDRFLVGFVLQQEMLLGARWEQTQLISSEGLVANESELAIKENTRYRSHSTGTCKSESAALSQPRAFEHKFGFELVPLPKAVSGPNLAKITFRTKSAPVINQKSGLDHVEFIKGLTSQYGPPQKLWPLSSFAITAKGEVCHQNGELVYLPKSNEYQSQQDSALDERFSLEEVLKFYRAAGIETDNEEPGVFGSSVAMARFKTQNLNTNKEVKALRRPSSHERKKKRIADLIKRLRRFESGEGTVETEAIPSPATEKIKMITELWEQRQQYRMILRNLAELKATTMCAFEGERIIEVLANEDRVPSFPIQVKDRESNWRRLGKKDEKK